MGMILAILFLGFVVMGLLVCVMALRMPHDEPPQHIYRVPRSTSHSARVGRSVAHREHDKRGHKE